MKEDKDTTGETGWEETRAKMTDSQRKKWCACERFGDLSTTPRQEPLRQLGHRKFPFLQTTDKASSRMTSFLSPQLSLSPYLLYADWGVESTAVTGVSVDLRAGLFVHRLLTIDIIDKIDKQCQ